MKLKNKAQIETWLEQSDFEEVIGELKKQLKVSKTGKALYSDALVLSAQLKKINADKIERVLSYEQESLALNNFRRSLVEFIGMVEDYEGEEEEAAPVFTPKKEGKTTERSGFAWWWLLLPLAALGIWLLFFKNDTPLVGEQKAIVKICTLNQMSNQGHCCTESLQRLSLFETGGVLYVTVALPGFSNPDPEVRGIVYWESGDIFPTQPIRPTLDATIGDICYVAIIQPTNGINWALGKYKLQIQVDGAVVGENSFEIIR